MKNAIKDSKTVTIQNKINDCKDGQKKIFKIIDSLLSQKKQQVLPEYTCSFSLATMINTFFVEKIDSIRAEFPLLEPYLLGLTWSCSATSNRQLGHHEVSTVVSNLHHPGCCCIQESRGDQGCC